MRYGIPTLLSLLAVLPGMLPGQCNNNVQFPASPVTASSFNDTVVVTTEQHAGQYFVVEGLALQETYVFGCSGSGDYLTIRDVYNPAVIITQGVPPVTWAVPAGGPDLLAVHVNKLIPPCGADTVDRATTVICTSCPGLPPTVGVGVTAPKAVLDVAGEIRVGDIQSPPRAGMIRWNPDNQDFEGYDGANWKSLTRSNSRWGQVPTQQANETSKSVATDGATNDEFGSSVAISGIYAIIGAPLDNVGANVDQGSAYVFKRLENNWVQEGKLTASDGAANDLFGSAVSIYGDYAIVGAWGDDVGANVDQGSVYIFKRTGPSWTEEIKLTASDGAANDYFGVSVSIYGEFAIIGASSDDNGANLNQGSAYVFKRTGNSWIQESKLLASDGAGNDYFGFSVGINGSVAGSYAIIGAYFDDIGFVDQGSAYVFKRSGSSWMQEAKLTAADAAANDNFGNAVSISGDYVIVGAYLDDVGANSDQGSGYVFKRTGTSWAQEFKLNSMDGAAFDGFGASVSIAGDYVIVGASGDDVGLNVNQGSVSIFKRTGVLWALDSKLNASDGAASDFFGLSISIAGNYIVSGSYGDDVGTTNNQGSVYFFTRNE